MEETHTMYLPLRIKMGKKTYPINLNAYRNWHFHVSNNLKILYKGYVSSQIMGVDPITKPIGLHCTYYFQDRRSKDVGNFHSIIEKFTLDALVELKIIPDDGIEWVRGSFYTFGGYKEKECAEITIIYDIEMLGMDARPLNEIWLDKDIDMDKE